MISESGFKDEDQDSNGGGTAADVEEERPAAAVSFPQTKAEEVDVTFPDVEAGLNSPLSTSSPAAIESPDTDSQRVVGRSGVLAFFNRNRTLRSDIDTRGAQRRNLDDSQRSSTAGRWRSLAGGSRMIRFASDRSDINNQEMRGIVATPISSGQSKPMTRGERFLTNIQNEVEDVPGNIMGLVPGVDHQAATERGREDSMMASNNQMYRLQATRGAKDVGCCRRTLRFLSACINCGALTESATEQNLYLGFGDPNQWLIYFFFWLFRKGWSTVLMLSIIWYYILVMAFAGIIVWASNIDNDCVKVGGNNLGDLERSKLMDAFSLSWSTFSTVGYGSTYPALSTETWNATATDKFDGNRDETCSFISFICSLEAFVGVIFAGFVGAIFFAKVARITQHADIRFSDPMTVRFGSGIDGTQVDDDEDRPQDQEKKKGAANNLTPLQKLRLAAKKVSKPSPFPIITFRIANENHGMMGGEIIGANVKAVVLIESTKYDDQVSEDLAKEITLDRMNRKAASKDVPRMRKISESGRTAPDSVSSVEDESSHSSSERSKDSAISYLHGLNALARGKRARKMKIDEEEVSGSKIVPRMVFTTLKLETSEHPLFKRIWRFKHHIDQDSPLLTTEAQKKIMKNGGHWPWEWNNHEAVRKAIRFNQMVVSFTGISNISGASVYRQKVYNYVDTVVGYQFVNALYRGRRGNLKVDLRLINDVCEQNGGGGEPLNGAGKDANL